MRRKNRLRRIWLPGLLAIAGVSLISFGAFTLLQRYRYLHKPAVVNGGQTVTTSTDRPDESDFNCDDYRVAPDQPLRITIDSINVNGCIQKVGIDQQNRVAAPQNIHMAGWYTGSAKPGESGVSLIDGHVQGRYKPGVFKKLDKLKPGDSIIVTRGDDTTSAFAVMNVRRYPADEAAAHMLAKEPDVDSQLNLITCGGAYDPALNSYEQRTIVTARRVNPT